MRVPSGVKYKSEVPANVATAFALRSTTRSCPLLAIAAWSQPGETCTAVGASPVSTVVAAPPVTGRRTRSQRLATQLPKPRSWSPAGDTESTLWVSGVTAPPSAGTSDHGLGSVFLMSTELPPPTN